ncbi:hypothetical protein BH10ACT1_BH10ACT1_17640 [soil metagenome]
MRSAPEHRDEQGRLEALHALGLLDTAPEERFDRIVRLAAAVFDVPMATVSLIDEDRQWFKSKLGLGEGETSRDVAFCAHAIVDERSETMVVPDARADDRFADNPLVTGDPNIRFYAGHVVHSPNGMPMGTLCVIDRKPREFDDVQRQVLADLAALVEEEFTRERSEAVLDRLHHSEQLKTSILDALTEGLVLHDVDGVILECNPAAMRLLGLSADELIGRTPKDPGWRAVHADGSPWPGEEHPAMVCLASGERMSSEVMGVHRPDGTLVWLAVSAAPTLTPEGERRVVATFVDITDRRRLEASLSMSEEVARTSLDALEQGVILFDGSGLVRRTNPAALAILGVDAEELTDGWRTDRWVLRDVDGAPLSDERRPLMQAILGGTVVDQVVAWDRPDGTRRLLRLSCVPNADGQGGILVAFTDITEEHRAAQEIARFQHLFEHSNDIILVLDPNGSVLYASPSTERILGYPPDWRHPEGIVGIVHPDDLAAVLDELVEVVAARQVREPFTLRVRAHSGDWRYVECVGTDLLEEPSVQGIVITARDATERIRLTAQLSHLASHDPLTGLPNRSVLEPQLELAMARAERDRTRVGLCFVDLDGFKLINDVHGHATGDQVIVEVADRIRSVTRASDTAARIGGDEFVVILDSIGGIREATEAARRVRDAILVPPIRRGEQVVGASVGVALNGEGETLPSLLVRADAALYQAKETHDSSVMVAPESGDGPEPLVRAGESGSP